MSFTFWDFMWYKASNGEAYIMKFQENNYFGKKKLCSTVELKVKITEYSAVVK